MLFLCFALQRILLTSDAGASGEALRQFCFQPQLLAEGMCAARSNFNMVDNQFLIGCKIIGGNNQLVIETRVIYPNLSLIISWVMGTWLTTRVDQPRGLSISNVCANKQGECNQV